MVQHCIGTFSHISPAMVHHTKDHVSHDEIKYAYLNWSHYSRK